MIAKEILRKSEVFSGLSDDELERVASLAAEKRFEAGSTIFQEGDTAEELFVIEDGRVALQMSLPRSREPASRRITVDVATKNDVLGWSVVVEPRRYTSTAICLQETKAVSLDGSKLRQVLENEPRIGYQILMGLVKVAASRLDDTRKVLVSERLFTPPASKA